MEPLIFILILICFEIQFGCILQNKSYAWCWTGYHLLIVCDHCLSTMKSKKRQKVHIWNKINRQDPTSSWIKYRRCKPKIIVFDINGINGCVNINFRNTLAHHKSVRYKYHQRKWPYCRHMYYARSLTCEKLDSFAVDLVRCCLLHVHVSLSFSIRNTISQRW